MQGIEVVERALGAEREAICAAERDRPPATSVGRGFGR